jgi:hypothetical protein
MAAGEIQGKSGENPHFPAVIRRATDREDK